MEKMLSRLFDYQRFLGNKRIADIIADTENRYNAAPLSDDMLELVSAAGDPDGVKCIDSGRNEQCIGTRCPFE